MGIAKQKMVLNSIETLFGGTNENITEVHISKLHSFKNHPFKVSDDEKMEELTESIKENGVITPAVVRKISEDEYELISGHRRKHACELAGIEKMPVIVKDLTDDEAAILMVDSNLQREEILPSEKAFAYKIKLEAMKSRNKVGRPSKESEKTGKTSIDAVAEEVGESRATVQRLIRLTNLNKYMLDKVDEKRLPVNVAVDISYLSLEQQDLVSQLIEDTETIPNQKQAKRLREFSESEKLTEEAAEAILTETKEPTISLKVDKEVKKLIPYDLSKEEVQKIMNDLLKQYLEEHYDITDIMPF